MKIAHIKIRNILGIEELDCTAGQFNEITGANGVNKSNFLNAIKSVVEGGHDATLLKKGATSGEVVLVLDDGLELRKKVTAEGSTTTVKKPGVKEPLKRPMDIINSIADLFSVNPIAFLNAKKDERAMVMLESMPIDLDETKLFKLAGIDPLAFAANVAATTKIDTVRQFVFDARTDINRALGDKRKTIDQLTQAMPEAPEGVVASETDLEAAGQELKVERAAALDELTGKVDTWMTDRDKSIAKLKGQHESETTAWRAEINDLNAKIAASVHQYNTGMGEIQESTSVAKQRAIDRRAEIGSKFDEMERPILAQLAAIRNNRNMVARREQTQETIKVMAEQASVLDSQSREHTEALEAIDGYKAELLSSLPIPGIEVKKGEIFRDGIPFDRLNTAQRTDIAIQLAKLRAGKLGAVCVDGLELLDPDAYTAFQEKAIASGLQFFVTRVGRGEFHITQKDS